MPSRRPKILIVNWGTWVSDLPFATAIEKKLDIYLASNGTHPQWMSEFVPANQIIITNTYDSDRLILDVTRFCHKSRISFDLVTTFFEMNIVQTADLAMFLGCKFISPDIARRTSANKELMRLSCLSKGIASPRFAHFDSVKTGLRELKRLGVPAVIKPVKSGHSYGVVRVDSLERNSFNKALNMAQSFLQPEIHECMPYLGSLKKEFLIEEFLRGVVISVDGLVYKNNIIICGITRYIMGHPPYFIQTGAIIPADIDIRSRNACFKEAKNVIKALGMNNCAFHCEMMLTERGPVLLEIAVRPPGGKMALGYQQAYGVNMIALYFDLIMGKKVNYEFREHHKMVFHNSIFTQKSGRIVDIEGLETLKKKAHLTLFWNAKVGDIIKPISNMPESILYYQIVSDSYNQLDDLDREIRKLYKCRIVKTPRFFSFSTTNNIWKWLS